MATAGYMGVGAAWQPHGRAVYRTDEYGRRVVVLPTHCPSGQHAFVEVGYTATEHDQTLRVSCVACREIPRPDHAWALSAADGVADAAEFDDGPYLSLLRRTSTDSPGPA